MARSVGFSAVLQNGHWPPRELGLKFIPLERVKKMQACATSDVALPYLCGNRAADLEFSDDLENTEDR
jgi:hypothetical protein